MKSFIKLITICAFLFGVCFAFSCCDADKNLDNSFSLEEYSWAIEQFPSNKKVGSISNSEEAVACARLLWDDEYGSVDGVQFDIYKDTVMNVKYDSDSGCWLVFLSMTRTDVLGSVPFAIIHEDGEVLALWLN